MKKKNLKNNEDNIFITEDLTKVRQSIIKELSTHKKAKKTKLLLDIWWPYIFPLEDCSVFGNFVITLIDMQLSYMEIFFKQSL
jgi:hypothetical protein